MKPYARNVPQIVQDALDNGDIERWARAGATDKQIYQNLGVSEKAWYDAKKQNPQVAQTIIRARKPVVSEAFEGLVRLSRGFEHTVTYQVKKEVILNGQIVTLHEARQETMYYPPNHIACTKVIVNYLNALKKQNKGIPEEYISEPVPVQQEQKQGRFPEMEEAMHEILFGGDKDES